MPKARNAISVIYEDGLWEHNRIDDPTLLSMGFAVNSLLGLSELDRRTFRDTELFILVAAEFQAALEEMRKFRTRFAKRKFGLIWFGSKGDAFRAVAKVKPNKFISVGEKSIPTETLRTLIQSLLYLEFACETRAITMPVSEIADRVDLAADAISDLRLNSTGTVIEGLRLISGELRGLVQSGKASNDLLEDPRPRLHRAFIVIAGIYDALENSRLASIIVSGAVTAMIGAGGWSSASCLALTLASWHGKDAFLAAIARLPMSLPNSKGANQPKSLKVHPSETAA